jgi:hypothetical protein
MTSTSRLSSLTPSTRQNQTQSARRRVSGSDTSIPSPESSRWPSSKRLGLPVWRLPGSNA